MSNKKLTAAERFAKLGERLQKDGRIQIDEAKLGLSEQIFQAMENKGISEAELSRRLNVSRAYVNKVLQGDTNFTIETLVKISIALDCEFKFNLIGNNKTEDVFDDVVYVKVEEIKKPNFVAHSPFPFHYNPNKNFLELREFEIVNEPEAVSEFELARRRGPVIVGNQQMALT